MPLRDSIASGRSERGFIEPLSRPRFHVHVVKARTEMPQIVNCILAWEMRRRYRLFKVSGADDNYQRHIAHAEQDLEGVMESIVRPTSISQR